MYAVNPSDRDLSCLRMLLLHVPGAKCYEDLRTVNTVRHNTFYEARVALNLLADDTQWINTLEEAISFRMLSQLRFLFATICCHCDLKSTLELWEHYEDAISEDFCRSYAAEDAALMALRHIQEIMRQASIRSKDLGLPEPPDIIEFSHGIDVETEARVANAAMAKLNDEQKQLIDVCIFCITVHRKLRCP